MVLAFVLAFGVTKAFANLAAGALADRLVASRCSSTGWLFALPVPLIIIWAPTWGWVVAANVLLGLNQGFAWSSTVIMKIDLVGPVRRGLAMGLNEAAGYLAVAMTALATGYHRRAGGTSTGALLPRTRVRRPGAWSLRSVRARDPRLCGSRG